MKYKYVFSKCLMANTLWLGTVAVIVIYQLNKTNLDQTIFVIYSSHLDLE